MRRLKRYYGITTIPTTNSRYETFQDIVVEEKNRTLLYGSLFLDNLNKQIKNMTDPPILYDEKRIDIIKYSDILL